MEEDRYMNETFRTDFVLIYAQFGLKPRGNVEHIEFYIYSILIPFPFRKCNQKTERHDLIRYLFGYFQIHSSLIFPSCPFRMTFPQIFRDCDGASFFNHFYMILQVDDDDTCSYTRQNARLPLSSRY
jgi:hypothetical protein